MAEYIMHWQELIGRMGSEYALTNVLPYWIGFALCMVGLWLYERRHA